MEFPQLGQHCSVKTCNLLDFLPMKCDSCSSIFCKDHIKYDEHECSLSYRKNIQVPICPLCNQAVPYERRDQSPDVVVSAHIDRDCKSDPAMQKRSKVYSNKCSVPSCKQREAIQVKCDKCSRTFCLRHRFPDDHNCEEFQRKQNEDISQTTATKLSISKKTQEETDFLLAQALQLSEMEETQRRQRYASPPATTTTRNNSADKKNCSIQ